MKSIAMLGALMALTGCVQPVTAKDTNTQAEAIQELSHRLDSIQRLLLDREAEDTKRRTELKKYNECNAQCAKEFPWKEHEPEYQQEDRKRCYQGCGEAPMDSFVSC